MSESVVALLSSERLARLIGSKLAGQRDWLLRCRVRRVDLTREQVVEAVTGWGREDAAAGVPVSHADRLPEPFRGVYLAAYRTTVRHAGPKPDSGGSG